MIPESPAGLRTTPAAAFSQPAAEILRWLAVAMLGLLATTALLLAWRRLAGALESPLGSSTLSAVALVAAAAAAAVRILGRSAGQPSSSPWPARALTWMPLAAVGVIGTALSLPGTSPAGLAAFWLILGVEEVWWLRGPRPQRPSAAQPRPASLPSGQFRYDPPQPPPPQPFSMMSLPEEVSPDDVVQQLTRSHAPDGSEVLAGWLRVAMAAGQRSANLHVAFCPPFLQTPRLAVEQLSGPPARIKTVRLFPYGTRFDLKLDQPSQSPSSLLLQFLARSAPPAGTSPEPEDEGRDGE